MAAPTPMRGPKPWTITLNVVNGVVESEQNDWQRQMIVKDTATFKVVVSPGEGSAPTDIVLVFTSEPATDANGNPVPKSYLPFGTETIENPDSSQSYTVKYSCKSMLKIKMLIDGRWVWCNTDERGHVKGKNVCTGGGGNPVNC